MFGMNSIMVGSVSAALFMSGTCSAGPCVSVHTDPLTHQIIITATQNTPGSTSTPAPVAKTKVVPPKVKPPAAITLKPPAIAPTVAPLPVLLKPIVAPTPKRPARPYTPRPYVYRYRPRVKKSATPAALRVAAVNLSDQISQLLPGNHLLHQPVVDPLSGVPIYFWSDAGNIFSLATAILGIGVNVALAPSFAWNFGDGTHLNVNSAGGPYPNSTVVHTYARAGSYEVDLDISWSGSWSSGGVLAPVLGGAIVQSLSAELVVAPGPTEFTG